MPTNYIDAPGLIADIGGTNARFALVDSNGAVRDVRILPCANYPDIVAAVEAYLTQTAPSMRPIRAAFAIASPITADRVRMTNLHWEFSIRETQNRLGLEEFQVLNDFTAVALSVPHLGEKYRRKVGGGEEVKGAPIAILGPGTGLGVSALVPVGDDWIPLVTEGGHVTMSVFSDRESKVLGVLRQKYHHVSAERILSGPGLLNLYCSVCEMRGTTPEMDIVPAQITKRGLDQSCSECSETLDLFCAMLGTVAANLALSMGARGGVYVAGGIVPRLGNFFDDSRFRLRFEDTDRFHDYMAAIPTYVVTHETPAFLGLSRRLTRR